ncbi:MAG: hypothetical protein PHE72_14680, partial [candidate division Zixibacteria bacterium]|nr:hypothetical protein [candidate division Zixibacteria bacterium]
MSLKTFQPAELKPSQAIAFTPAEVRPLDYDAVFGRRLDEPARAAERLRPVLEGRQKLEEIYPADQRSRMEAMLGRMEDPDRFRDEMTATMLLGEAIGMGPEKLETISRHLPEASKAAFGEALEPAEIIRRLSPYRPIEKLEAAPEPGWRQRLRGAIEDHFYGERYWDGERIRRRWMGRRPDWSRMERVGRQYYNQVIHESVKPDYYNLQDLLENRARAENAAVEDWRAWLAQKGVSEATYRANADAYNALRDRMIDSYGRAADNRLTQGPGLVFDVAPPADAGESAADIGVGLAAFMTKMLVARKLIGAVPGKTALQAGPWGPRQSAMVEPMVWEGVNQAEGGVPGAGAAMGFARGRSAEIPTATIVGTGTKVLAESGLFAAQTAVEGGTKEEILTSAIIPAVMGAMHEYRKTGAVENTRQGLMDNARRRMEARTAPIRRQVEGLKGQTILGDAEAEGRRTGEIKRLYAQEKAVIEGYNQEVQKIDQVVSLMEAKLRHSNAFRDRNPRVAVEEMVEELARKGYLWSEPSAKLAGVKGDPRFRTGAGTRAPQRDVLTGRAVESAGAPRAASGAEIRQAGARAGRPGAFEGRGQATQRFRERVKKSFGIDDKQAAAAMALVEARARARGQGTEEFISEHFADVRASEIDEAVRPAERQGVLFQEGDVVNADIVHLFEQTDADKQFRGRVEFGRVEGTTAERIRQETGLDVEGYRIQIGSDEIRHMIKRHDRTMDGPQAITKEILGKVLPMAMEEFDRVEARHDDSGQNRLVFEKRINGWLVAVEVVSDKRKRLLTKTVYIRSRRTTDAAWGNPGPYVRNDSGPDDSIAKEGEEIKENPDILYQTGGGPVWVSRLGQVVQEKMGGVMEASELAAMLKKAGVKDEEIEWSGVGELIESRKTKST